MNIINTIEEQIDIVKKNGVPVIVNNQGTLEVINHSFCLNTQNRIEVNEIKNQVKTYYEKYKIPYKEIEDLEKDEYEKIIDGVTSNFPKILDDINTRQAVWVSPWCISMIHFIVRNNIIYCFVKMRSSNVVKLLASDLGLILTLCSKLQEYLGTNKVIVDVNISSLHIVAIDDITVLKGVKK